MLSRCASVLVLAFCLFVFGRGTTLAQSLDLSGAENQWFYGYYGQLGSRGFFGDYNVDASSTGGNLASLNAWVGNRPFPDIGFLVSGTNASLSSLSLAITPRYGNEWVILKARYNINAYNTGTAPGALVPISPGQLTLWSVQVNSPVASIRFGKQIFQKGFNLQFSNNRTTEYLMLEQRFCVPDILGCLVGAGFLPKGVMSWFNPHLWPRYKKGVTANPEDELFGDPQTGKSIFAQRDEAQKKDPFFAEGVLAETPEETERKKH